MSHYTSRSRLRSNTIDLDFDHGFIPRIGSQNYKALDRCLGPDTLLDALLDLPWAIVDAQWAEKNTEFLVSLRAHGSQILLDRLRLAVPLCGNVRRWGHREGELGSGSSA